MEMTPYVRRDELLLDRSAAVESLKGIKSLFVATFAEELPHRWELAEQAWFEVKVGHISPEDFASYRKEANGLYSEARKVAESHLGNDVVWGHELPRDDMRRVNEYIPTGTGAQWTYVSPAICAAEKEVISVLEDSFGPANSEPDRVEFGAVSEPLGQILHTYAHAFKRLQRVDIALDRVERHLPRSRPNVTSGKRR